MIFESKGAAKISLRCPEALHLSVVNYEPQKSPEKKMKQVWEECFDQLGKYLSYKIT
jgi:hypothetical protein